jgi:hypothetical protein
VTSFREQRIESTRIAVLLVVLAYGAVGGMLEWWPIDGLNLAQYRAVGWYSSKLSTIVFIAVVALGQTLLWSALGDFVTRRLAARAGATGAIAVPPSPPRTHRRPLARSQLHARWALATVLAIWVAAAAVYFWLDSQQRSDNTAQYAQLGLESSPPVRLAPGDHVSVQGLVLASRALSFVSDSRSERPAYFLIPVVPPGWRAGEAARVLLRLDSPSALPGFRPAAARLPWMLPESVLGRVRGHAPLTAQTEFEKMDILLAPDNQVLEVVPSQGGKPVQRNINHLEWVLWGAGIASVLMVLMFVGAFLIAHRRERAAMPTSVR